jgi:RNA polymerase sigma factor (sigma-70 family)
MESMRVRRPLRAGQAIEVDALPPKNLTLFSPDCVTSRSCVSVARMAEIPTLICKLRKLLLSRGRVPHDVEDLMQEAFLRLQVYCRDHTVHNTEAFMVQTTLNLSAEQARRAQVRRGAGVETQLLELLDPAPSPEEIYAMRQRFARARRGLERMSPRSREAFLLHRVDGLSYAQIAERLDISVSMVEKHIARACYFLRDWMTGDVR